MQHGAGPWEVSRRAAMLAALGAGVGYVFWPDHTRAARRAPRGRIELTYWEKWTGPEGAALQQIVDWFNQSQDRLWVRLLSVSDITSKAMVAIGGGDPPDLVGLFTFSIPVYSAARAIMPLTEFAHLGAFELDRYAPGIAALLAPDGMPWAGVNTCYTLGLYYNRRLFLQAGLDPDAPPRTTEQLLDVAEALTLRDAAGRITQLGFGAILPPWWPYIWPMLFDAPIFDKLANRCTIASPGCVAAYEWVQQSAARLGPAAVRAFAQDFGRSMHGPGDPFISQRTAMIVQGPWVANFIRQYSPDLDFFAAPVPLAPGLPEPDRPRGLLEADVIMIPRGCPHPEEAYQFLQFTQRQDVQEKLCSLHCKPSPLREVSEQFRRTHPNPAVDVFDAIAKSPRVSVLPQTSVWERFADETTSAFDAVWDGADVSATLHDLESRLQRQLDRAADIRRRRDAARGAG
ncbi:MAG: extracellular solute-binding protein [Leptolyngbya sp. PLA3]|nr:MAG: extracellular solute-binding protein [Cyanobacteria bacterium CYA]MCE7967209.1 extracellular solute-binding protein [Leptolyngbya sp. PL-A3]